MGLDMYAGILKEPPETDVDFNYRGTEWIYEWRKHPDLHGWMEALYWEKGGDALEFNCAGVVLDTDDLDRLEGAIRSRTLPETEGCFFGESDGSEFEDDLEFLAIARKAIDDGLTVFYTSWW